MADRVQDVPPAGRFGRGRYAQRPRGRARDLRRATVLVLGLVAATVGLAALRVTAPAPPPSAATPAGSPGAATRHAEETTVVMWTRLPAGALLAEAPAAPPPGAAEDPGRQFENPLPPTGGPRPTSTAAVDAVLRVVRAQCTPYQVLTVRAGGRGAPVWRDATAVVDLVYGGRVVLWLRWVDGAYRWRGSLARCGGPER